MPEHGELLKDAATGDAEAFGALVPLYIDDVYSFLRYYTGSSEDAEDATQEAFVKAWRSMRRFDTTKPFRPWLLRIAKNAATDLLRKRRGIVFSALADEDFAQKVEDPEPLPDEVFARKELGKEVREILDTLPEADRAVLTLRYMDELSFDDIAEILSTKSTTVRSIHHRALKKLRELLVT